MDVTYHKNISLADQSISLRHEFVSPGEYIGFLKGSALGEQYPKEDFDRRIGVLLKNVQISLIARDEAKKIIGVCLGLTDFAYWLLVTDIGVDRTWERKGLGRELISVCHELAGGEQKIILFAYANEKAVPFYEKLGMKRSVDMMEKNHVDWTEFVVT